MRHKFERFVFTAIAGFAFLGLCGNAGATTISVTVENLAPGGGIYFTPVWVGFHDGSFDLFDAGTPTPPGGGLENIAEDGDFSVLSGEFSASSAGGAGGVDGVVLAPAGFGGAPVFDPGDSGSASFDLDPMHNRYFSFASMVVPSNDAFIGNGDPQAVELFDAAGNFTGPISFVVLGSQVWDAGTEANTETDAAFFDQTAPNTGTTTSDAVLLHAGYLGSVGNPVGPARILGGTSTSPPGIFFDSVAADFTLNDYAVAQITIVPEPSTLVLLGCGGALSLVLWGLRQQSPVG